MKQIITLLLLHTFIAGSLSAQGGSGSLLLPGNSTCENEYIYVTPCGGITSVSYNGYNYPLVEIGGQCWFAENLKTIKYRDHTPIDYPGADDNAWESNTAGAYAWFNNDSAAYASDYGALYSWHAVDNAKGLCPAGWHIPTDCEWMYLEDSLGMSIADQENTAWRGTDEGNKLKETGTAHWPSPNTDATNSSGFTALPGGLRYANGYFFNFGSAGGWWTSSKSDLDKPWYRIMDDDKSYIGRWEYSKTFGFSVRCIKDTSSVQGSLKKTINLMPLNINPNPFSQSTTISLPSNEQYTLSVYNITGRIVRETKDISSAKVIFNKEQLSRGIYFIELSSSKHTLRGKLVIE